MGSFEVAKIKIVKNPKIQKYTIFISFNTLAKLNDCNSEIHKHSFQLS